MHARAPGTRRTPTATAPRRRGRRETPSPPPEGAPPPPRALAAAAAAGAAIVAWVAAEPVECIEGGVQPLRRRHVSERRVDRRLERRERRGRRGLDGLALRHTKEFDEEGTARRRRRALAAARLAAAAAAAPLGERRDALAGLWLARRLGARRLDGRGGRRRRRAGGGQRRQQVEGARRPWYAGGGAWRVAEAAADPHARDGGVRRRHRHPHRRRAPRERDLHAEGARGALRFGVASVDDDARPRRRSLLLRVEARAAEEVGRHLPRRRRAARRAQRPRRLVAAPRAEVDAADDLALAVETALLAERRAHLRQSDARRVVGHALGAEPVAEGLRRVRARSQTRPRAQGTGCGRAGRGGGGGGGGSHHEVERRRQALHVEGRLAPRAVAEQDVVPRLVVRAAARVAHDVAGRRGGGGGGGAAAACPACVRLYGTLALFGFAFSSAFSPWRAPRPGRPGSPTGARARS